MFIKDLSKMQIQRLLLLICALLIGLHAYVFWPVSTDRKQRASVLLENSFYYLVENGKDTLYFNDVDTVHGLAALSLSPDNCVFRQYELGYFTSWSGKIRTAATAFRAAYDSLYFAQMEDSLLTRCEAFCTQRLTTLEKQGKELDYIVSTHMNADEGYSEMVSLQEKCQAKQAEYEELAERLKSLSETMKKNRWQRVCQLKAVYVPEKVRIHYACRPLTYHRKYAETQLTEEALPVNASSILNPVFRCEKLAQQAETLQGDTVASQEKPHYMGKLQGKDFYYVGELAGNTPEGLGFYVHSDCLSDSSKLPSYYVAAQGLWLNGLLNGEALRVDYTTDVTQKGVWAYDHLAGGTMTYPDGSTYEGSLMQDSVFDGAGEMNYADGSVYSGSWASGMREGFGILLTEKGTVQSGSWKEDSYEGERILYTADRVYGIDMARYQHLNRRGRACGVNWSDFKITSLGHKSSKRISGAVSYPVSFIYFKATQGASIVNKYFRSDYQKARVKGIHVGSYHFFSAVPVKLQLKWFFRNNIYHKGDLPPVLDLEPTDAFIRKNWGSDARMFAQVLAWLKAVEARYGVKPILYVSQKFIQKHLSRASAELQSYDLWVARYGEFKPYSHLLYWQLSPDGRVKGIQSEVDINVFNGSKERFEDYVNSLK